jgi:hypothetical protein
MEPEEVVDWLGMFKDVQNCPKISSFEDDLKKGERTENIQ